MNQIIVTGFFGLLGNLINLCKENNHLKLKRQELEANTSIELKKLEILKQELDLEIKNKENMIKSLREIFSDSLKKVEINSLKTNESIDEYNNIIKTITPLLISKNLDDRKFGLDLFKEVTSALHQCHNDLKDINIELLNNTICFCKEINSNNSLQLQEKLKVVKSLPLKKEKVS